MNILFDIGHPAHVHLLKNTIKELQLHGHKIIITTKDVPIIKRLLDNEGFSYINLGKKGEGLKGKILKQFHFFRTLYKIIKKEKIRIAAGTSMTIPLLSKISKMSSINMDDDDDEVQKLSVLLCHPFSDVRLSPSALIGHRKSKKAIFYAGYHELAYLHPKRFKPDIKVLEKANIKKDEKFFILRFVAFKAYHDTDAHGLSLEDKRKLINILAEKGRVIITSEKELEPEFEKYRLSVPPEDMHSLLYYSTLLIGDSQTMTSEAAVLGVPSLRCNTFVGKIAYLEEEENKYGLTYGFRPDNFDGLLSKLKELLMNPNLKQEWIKKREKLLNDKIDVTSFFVWFIENYPESKKIMKENPDYQYNFK